MRQTPLSACIAALALSACATPVPVTQAAGVAAAANAAGNIIAAATLSASPITDALAPAYTRNALLRKRAARALDRGDITATQARAVLMHTDEARRQLDQARERAALWRLTVAGAEMDKAEEVLR